MTTLATTCIFNARPVFFTALLVVGVLGCLDSADATSERKLNLSTPRQRMDVPKLKQNARPHLSSSCAEFGRGFVRLPGSDSCIRVGGGVEMGVGAVP